MTGMAHPARAALYWAPPVDDPLHSLGSTWLGRDAETGATLPQPAIPGLDLHALTGDPRGYGLHATLKPPFRLAGSYAALRDDAARMAAATEPFDLPPLEITSLSGFLALRESAPCPALQALADACVATLDVHRVPPDEAEIARRRPERLSPAGRHNLYRWGYPQVFGEWRFHVTLTQRLTPEQDAAIRPVAEAMLGNAAARPRRVTELCLFTQPAPGQPFLLAERLPLGG
jgi:putative phosphonate metabolism protein